MNNLINSRVSSREAKTVSRHNVRSSDIKITDNQQIDKVKNNQIFNYVMMDGKATKITEELSKEIQKEQLKIYDSLFSEFKEKYETRRNRKLTKDRHIKNLVQDNVLTFSEAVKSDLNNKYSIEEFMKVAQDTVNEYCKEYNAEMIENSLVLHLDEETPHFHYQLKNFDSIGRNLEYQMKLKKLSKLQDIAAENFKIFGIERGISKQINRATNTETWKFKQQEVLRLEQENKELKIKNENLIKLNNKSFTIFETLKKMNDMLLNVSEVKQEDIIALKEQYKSNKEVIKVVNNIQRAKNHIVKNSEYSKVDKALKLAKTNLAKLTTYINKSEINYNAIVDKKAVLEFKKNKENYIHKDKHNKIVLEIDSKTIKIFSTLEEKLNLSEAEKRILKNQVKNLESENKTLKSSANSLIDELEEVEEFVESKGLNSDFREFKQSTMQNPELFKDTQKDNSNHNFKR